VGPTGEAEEPAARARRHRKEDSLAILSLQSHVAYGHVGNRAAVLPLELLGFEVWPINTVQFSNHTGYPSWRGEVFSPAAVGEVWRGIRELGVAQDCEAVLSGYLGKAGVGEVVLDAVREVRAASPRALYCCDPVMGDAGRGLFVGKEVVDFFRDRVCAAADILTPNQYEAELLSGMRIDNLEAAKRAAALIHERGPRIVLITSCLPLASVSTSVFLSEGGGCFVLRTAELPLRPAPNGAGDLFAALFLGHYLRTGEAVPALELSVNALFAVLETGLARGGSELALSASIDALLHPPARFKAEAV
jgi:pyridoxine kinase